MEGEAITAEMIERLNCQNTTTTPLTVSPKSSRFRQTLESIPMECMDESDDDDCCCSGTSDDNDDDDSMGTEFIEL